MFIKHENSDSLLHFRAFNFYNNRMEKSIQEYLSSISEENLYDPMTGVYNKDVFLSVCSLLIKQEIPFALYIIDFDNFKKVNDTYGHQVGDKALTNCANVIKYSVGDKGLVCRYGGDEFAVVAPRITERTDAWQIARDFSQEMRNRPQDYLVNAFPNGRITFTTGSARYPLDATSLNDLFHLADKALYRGKFKGKNCFIIYDPKLHKNIDISAHSNKMNQISMIKFTFNMFAIHDDTMKALSNVVNFTGNYFQDAFITYFDSDGDHLLFENENNDKQFHYESIDPNIYNMTSFQTHMTLYYNDLLGDPKNNHLLDLMRVASIRTMMIYRCTDKKGNNAFLCVYANRDKIWSEEEDCCYESIAQLLSLLNKKNLK